MIFGKSGFFNRRLLNHFAHTFSLSYFFRLIATLVGVYSRSRRVAQTRNASPGGQVLRRIYGHIVAQGLGAEKLTAIWEMPDFPRRNLGAVGQIGMASVIVLLAWIYWPGEAAAPAFSSAIAQPVAGQVTIPTASASSDAALASSDTVSASSRAPSVENASAQQIEATKERFSALTSQQAKQQVSQLPLPAEPARFGVEIEDATALPASSAAETQPRTPEAETKASDRSATSSQSGDLSALLASLAAMTAAPRAAVHQAVAGVGELATGTRKTNRPQPPSTSTPAIEPTAVPALGLLPGPQWAEFTPPAAPAADHFWLGQPHPSGYDQFYSPNYQFGSTANNRYRIHHGVDISNSAGTPVLAMGEGEVVHAGPDNPTLLGPYNNFYGNAVVIRLNRRLPTPEGDQDVYVLLGHLSAVYVERGQQVTPDLVVGAVGMTGIAIGPHLHVEVRVGHNSYLESVNPALWMQNAPGTGAVAARLLTADGRSWPLARLSLLRYESGGSRWVRTLEIYPDAENISADPAWGENGALSNLAAGSYWIGGVVNGEKFGQNITINSGETTFVELRTQQ